MINNLNKIKINFVGSVSDEAILLKNEFFTVFE